MASRSPNGFKGSPYLPKPSCSTDDNTTHSDSHITFTHLWPPDLQMDSKDLHIYPSHRAQRTNKTTRNQLVPPSCLCSLWQAVLVSKQITLDVLILWTCTRQL